MIIKLGDEVKDLITGYEGIVIARIDYLNGCVQYGVKARVKDAALKEAEYIDKDQLVRLGPGLNKADNAKVEEGEEPETGAPRGGFQPDGPQKKKHQRKGYY